MPVPALLVTGALILSVAAYGLTASTAVDIETRRRAADEAVQLIGKTIQEVEGDLEAARGRNDVVEAARLESLRDQLRVIRDQSNPRAAQRQAEQLYESFAETESRKAVLGQLAGQIPGGGFSVMEMWDLLTALTQEEDTKEHPSDLLEKLKGSISDARTKGRLPDNLPDYIVQSTMRDVLAKNPQVAELPAHERRRFLCEQARKKIDQLIIAEADPTRGKVLDLARAAACRVTARGEITIPSEARRWLGTIRANELCLTYEVGGAAKGSVLLDVDLSPAVLALAQQIGASVGTAVGDTLTLGLASDKKGKKKKPKTEKCTGKIRVEATLEGKHTGESASGTATVAKTSGLDLRCESKKQQIELGDKDLGLTWSATEGDTSVKVVLGDGKDTFTTDLPISTKQVKPCPPGGGG
jgi:hypothetical protein